MSKPYTGFKPEYIGKVVVVQAHRRVSKNSDELTGEFQKAVGRLQGWVVESNHRIFRPILDGVPTQNLDLAIWYVECILATNQPE